MSEQTNILDAIRTVVKEETRDFSKKSELFEFKDIVLTALDANSKKLDQILAEHPAMNHAIDENRNRIASHENRIQKVEAKAGLA